MFFKTILACAHFSAIYCSVDVHVSSPDDALGSILVETPELGGHVGECSQTVGVEILILLRMETKATRSRF